VSCRVLFSESSLPEAQFKPCVYHLYQLIFARWDHEAWDFPQTRCFCALGEASSSCVKSHAKGIFVKLAVQTRAHAVSKAGALGLL
jgi:hypothetical protein